VIHDLRGASRVIPFVTHIPKGNGDGLSKLEGRFEKAAALAASASIEFRLPSSAAVYSMEPSGRLLKETAKAAALKFESRRMAKKRSSPKSRESEPSPEMWIVEGPNGAGKSTFLENLGTVFTEIVRPDEFALRLSAGAPESGALSAGRLALDRMRELIASRKPFAVETTLSGRLHRTSAEEAKRAGWRIILVYIGLADSQLATSRVGQRRGAGGHDVPAFDIVRRYNRGAFRIYRAGFE
jgi:predicted ABC-type ATPase